MIHLTKKELIRRHKAAKKRIWELVDPSQEGYGNLIEKLMDKMFTFDLEHLAEEMDGVDSPEGR